MWAGTIHLLLGNAAIGLGEGLLLAWPFGATVKRCVGTLILANYASAWIGKIAICGMIAPAIPMDLNNGWRWFRILAAAAYGLTLIPEWPFILWCLRGKEGLLRRSLWASPADKVLFQLGTDQICAFDPATRRVALLWHGRGPVAVLERMSRDL